MRKILMTALAVIVALSAAPLSAQVAGTWMGEGKGVCSPPPFWPTDIPIYAWQKWTGEIPDSENSFKGEWHDETGKFGHFSGKIIAESINEVYCEGKWTWVYGPDTDPPQEYVMGPFKMWFHKEKLICHGEWSTSYSNEGGKMWGGMVD